MEPPIHMPVAYGPVKPAKVKPSQAQDSEEIECLEICLICKESVKKTDIMRCLSSSCELVSHIICLAGHMLRNEGPGVLLPVEGPCPSCHESLLWGDLVRLKRGCYQRQEESQEDHWADSLTQPS